MMQRMASGLLAVCVPCIAAMSLADSAPRYYVHKPTWAQSALSTREAYRRLQSELQFQRKRLGIEGLEIRPWLICKFPFLASAEESLLHAELPPEIAARQNRRPVPMVLHGGKYIEWGGIPTPWNWTDGLIAHCSDAQIAPPGAANFLFREILAPEPRTVKAYLGSSAGVVVWLNDAKVLLQDAAGRDGDVNPQPVDLPLRKGLNHLLVKVVHKSKLFDVYLSLLPEPGDWRDEAIQAAIWRQLEKDFPAPTREFREALLAHPEVNWLEANDVALEKGLLDRALGGRGSEDLRRQYHALIAAGASCEDPRWLELVLSARHAWGADQRRRCPPVVFLRRQEQGRRGTNATMLGQGTTVGSEICVYDPATPEAPPRVVFRTERGFIFDMSLSYDARKVVFSYMESLAPPKGSFHLWEINLDGTGLRQLTDDPYHDGSPVYLPDGRIVFCSTRVEAFSMCQDHMAAGLFVRESDSGRIRRVEYSSLCDVTPYVMDDGSVLYTRWEYQDKNIFCTQGLWTINPDGSRVQLYYGNTLMVPNSLYGAKQIPGTRKAICVMAPHHGQPLGAIGLIDRSQGLESEASMVNLTPEIPYTPRVGKNWRETGWDPGDRIYAWAYTDPYPLAEDLFLVSYGGPVEGGPQRYRLYLMDDRGEKALLYDDGNRPRHAGDRPMFAGTRSGIVPSSLSCFNALPLRPRALPTRLPGEAKPASGEGEFFVADIYQGLLDKGVQRGQIKQLRVMSQIPKKYNTEGPRYNDEYPIMSNGTYYAKYCWGTVPVDDEGTAYFKAPAGVELYFIALDAHGKEVRRMGTVTQITAGERQGCIGCHESRFLSPPATPGLIGRLSRGPDSIAPEPWGAGPVSFVRQVQPVLDKYCVRCHSGRVPQGGIDLSGGRTRFFNMAYEAITDGKWVEFYHLYSAPTGNFPPLASGSWTSRLTRLLEEKHQQTDVPDIERRRIYSWIDANAPYYDTWDMSRPHTRGGRDPWNQLLVDKGSRRRIVPEPWTVELNEVFRARCIECHPVGGRAPDLWEDGGRQLGRWFNLSQPEFSLALNAHLGKKAGGMGIDKLRDGRAPPKFADTGDAIYLAMLRAIEKGKQALEARPRMDMPGAVVVPQQRDFGRLQ